ncbi:hypothetical protein FA95DRAFT_1557029 [Auriscalpium vulgare]|uniref:Uncharacterized protein n=1 Tax=Auriscalpium vulgare TaxID=40419 RepID=A0ACB8RYR8_9AGAM|nr:hypothetical protein FA95DRAFT_1557029 [Auriscalpium vulgare]
MPALNATATITTLFPSATTCACAVPVESANRWYSPLQIASKILPYMWMAFWAIIIFTVALIAMFAVFALISKKIDEYIEYCDRKDSKFTPSNLFGLCSLWSWITTRRGGNRGATRAEETSPLLGK